MLQPAKAHAAESTVSVTSEKLRLPIVTLIHDTVPDRNGIATLEYPLLAVGFPALIQRDRFEYRHERQQLVYKSRNRGKNVGNAQFFPCPGSTRCDSLRMCRRHPISPI